MENNKLAQITRRLYEEGLSKGQAEGGRLVAEAEAEAKKIVARAEDKARKIVRAAEDEASELRKNTATEIALAGRQAVARIREEISGAVVARTIGDGVHKAALDPAFIKEMLLAVAASWKADDTGKVSLEALLPAARKKELDAAFEGSVGALLKEGVEVGYSRDVKSGFRLGEKGGGYYIGFEDENFEALLSGYLRQKVTTILYGAE
jgi:V/A-type H+-transporting ATPase subunit E